MIQRRVTRRPCAGVIVAGVFALALLPRAAVALQPGQRFDQYGHAAWPTLAHASTIHSMLPAGQGQLWVATSEGLVHLDGQRATPVDGQRLPGMVERDVRALLEARDGAVWIGAAGRGLARMTGARLSPWSASAVAGRDIYDLVETPDGTMWAGGKAGVARFSSRLDPGPVAADASAGLPHRCTHVFAFHPGPQVLWAGTHAGLARWNGQSWQRQTGPVSDDVAGVAIDALLAEADGTLWVGTRGAGLWQRQGEVWRRYAVKDGLGSDEVTSILRDRAGRLWVATRGAAGEQPGGLAWLKDDAFVGFPLDAKMCADRIEALAEDGEGGLWLGTKQCGLHRLWDRPWHTLTTLDGLPSDQVLGLATTRPGGPGEAAAIIAGTRGAGTARWHEGRFEPLSCDAGLPCQECWDFSANLPGAAVAGFSAVCRRNVLRSQQTDRTMVRLSPMPPGMPTASFALQSGDGAVWLARDKQVVRWHDGTAIPLPTQELFEGARILFEDRDGSVWIGADDGLAQWRKGHLRIWRLPPGDHPAEIANFHQDAAGTLWMATKGEGIRRFQPETGRIDTIGVGQGLPTGWIVQLLQDGQGRLWASSSHGIFWLPARELDEVAAGTRARVSVRLYDGNDGVIMRAEPFGHPAGFADRGGRLWFATSGGIVVVDPSSPAWQVPVPRVTIDQARVDNQIMALAAPKLVMAGAQADLDVTFSARTFAAEGTVSFRYRLGPGHGDGDLGAKNGDWIELGSSRSLHHARLAPGDYQLAIEARTREGNWSGRPTELGFSLRPPFHRSPAFLLLLLAGAAAVLLGGHRLRIRRTRAELQAVMTERSRIAREIHDTLAQAFVATSVQLECLEDALEGEPRLPADGSTGARIRHHLATAKRVVHESLEEARRAVWVLRPQAIGQGLVPALQIMVQRVSGSTPVDLVVSGAARDLSPLVASNLLRIAQEAVANAHRHGRAHRITLRLAFSPASVTLTVADDGQGLGHGEGMGILGMKERAAQIGGTLTIETGPPPAVGDPASSPPSDQSVRGTCVRVEVAA